MSQYKKCWLWLASLACGIAAPIVYFGIQVVAAPFYPGYSFLSDDASTLGSSSSTFPGIFNVGSFAVGVLLLLASVSIPSATANADGRRTIAWLIALSMIAGAIGSVNAGLYPLPDERHINGVLANIGGMFFVLPLLLPFLFPSRWQTRMIRVYAWLNLLVLLTLVPIISGLIQRAAGAWQIELGWYQEWLNNGFGVLQRIAAAVMFGPVGVLCWFLLRQLRVRKQLDVSESG